MLYIVLMLPAWLPVGLETLSLANNVFSELPEGLTACSRWERRLRRAPATVLGKQ
jgi:hypothetical protein